MAKTTRARKTAALRKPRSTKTAPKRVAPEPVPPVTTTPSVVAARPAVVTAPSLRKQDLVDAVMARADVKKSVAKPIVEAVLSVLGETVAKEQELNLPPFGKLKIQKIKDTANARITVAKLRQSKPKPSV